VIGGGHRDISM
jgi:hypothetical protein